MVVLHNYFPAKEVPWNWSNERERAFQNVKKRLTEAPILAYFDTNKEVVLQIDSSKNGVGAVLLQDGKPVITPSNTLGSSCISKNGNAELGTRSLSSGHPFRINSVTDCKLASFSVAFLTSKRLQDIIMKLFRYDIEFRFVKGVNLIVADALNRSFVCNDNRLAVYGRSVQLLCGHMYTGQNVRVHTTWTVLLFLFAPSLFRTVLAQVKRILRAFRGRLVAKQHRLRSCYYRLVRLLPCSYRNTLGSELP
jgi:hypothetical protein